MQSPGEMWDQIVPPGVSNSLHPTSAAQIPVPKSMPCSPISRTPRPCIPQPHVPASCCPSWPYPASRSPASCGSVYPYPASRVPTSRILCSCTPHPAAPYPASPQLRVPTSPQPSLHPRIPQPRCPASYNTKSHRLLALRPAALGPTARHPCIPWSHILRGCLPQTSQPTSRSSPSLQPYILSLHPAVLSPSSLSPVLALIPLPRLLAACTPQPRSLAPHIPTPHTLQPASPAPYSYILLPHTPAIHSQLRVPVSCSPALLQLTSPAP